MRRGAVFAAVVGVVFGLAGCAGPADVSKAAGNLPVMRWDHRPESDRWTADTLAAIYSHGTSLIETIPADIDTWCPGYETAGADDRAAFWAGLLSALAKHESTWNPKASGGGGLWIGLTQIDPRTARAYDCNATTVGELKNGSANLSCAVRIAAYQVARDDAVVSDGSGGWRGMSRDWAPFRSSSKRQDMAAWTSAQPYCQPKRKGLFGL